MVEAVLPSLMVIQSHGVTVAQQVLVLFDKVRILVGPHIKAKLNFLQKKSSKYLVVSKKSCTFASDF